MQSELKARNIESLYTPLEAPSLVTGLRQMMTLLGVGKLEPNVIMCGFLTEWKERAYCDMKAYFDLVQNGVAIIYSVNFTRF